MRIPAARGMTNRLAVAAGVVLALYVATRLSFIARFPYFLDEGTYAVFTYRGSRSTHDLFISFTIGREPLMFWLGIPWVKLGFNPLTAVRLVSMVSGLLTMVVVGLLARRLGETAVGLAAAALCVVLPFFLVHDAIGIIEPLVTLVMAGALYLQVELARRPDLKVGILLGLVLAAGILTKENTKPALALVPLSLLCFDWSPADRRRRLTVWLGGVVIAAGMVLGAMLLLRSSSIYPLYEASRKRPLIYTVRTFDDVLAHPFAELGRSWAVYRPALTGYVTIPLLAVAVAGAVLGLRRRLRLTALLVAWIAVPFATSLLFSALPYPRHIMYLMPPIVVLAAYALVEGARLVRSVMAPRRATAAAAAVVGLVLAPGLLLDARVLADPGSARYPGLDDVQYVTGTGAGSVWPDVADTIRRRGRGRRVVLLTSRSYSQVLEMLLGPDRRYVFVSGRSPLADRAQFDLDDDIPFSDPDAGEAVRRGRFVPVGRFARPRGGATLTLSECTRPVPRRGG